MSSDKELPLIKLSAEFLKLLRTDELAAYALRPVFAARADRLSSNKKKWLPRAVLLSADGTLRVFDTSDGRITHTIDVLNTAEEAQSLDAIAGDVPQRYSHIAVVVDSSVDSETQTQCVRFTGKCAVLAEDSKEDKRSNAKKKKQQRKSSYDDDDTEEEESSATQLEDDFLLKFPSSSDAPMALTFAAALRHFALLRSKLAHRDDTFSFAKSPKSLELLATSNDKAYQQTTRNTIVVSRPKPNKIASSLRIFKNRSSYIHTLGEDEKQSIESFGGVVKAPVESPRPVNAPLEEDAAKTTLPSDENASGALGIVKPALDEGALVRQLVMRDLMTIPVSTQEDVHIPTAFVRLLKKKHEVLQELRDVNRSRLVRWKLLEERASFLKLLWQSRADAQFQLEEYWLSAVDDIIEPYQQAVQHEVHTFGQSLLKPLPAFDSEAFHHELYDLNKKREELQEALHAAETILVQQEVALQTPLQEDPVHALAVEESRAALARLCQAQSVLDSVKRSVEDECRAAHDAESTRCQEALARQEAELSHLRHVHRSLQSVFAISHELTHDVPVRGDPFTSRSLSSRGASNRGVASSALSANDLNEQQRRVRMKLDV